VVNNYLFFENSAFLHSLGRTETKGLILNKQLLKGGR
jgi:hypothetical protein